MMMLLRANPRVLRVMFPLLLIPVLILLFGITGKILGYDVFQSKIEFTADEHRGPNLPKYKPEPDWTPPPVIDPFPLLVHGEAPAIPAYNVPAKDLHLRYGLSYAPPLFIGFTRQWGILLQCVVAHITAGWPASSIYVVENTGVQISNRDGKLTLQNPFYMNYAALKKLGVNVIRTPVLLSFAQLQNFFLATAHENDWPYYFWSHQDALVFSYENGADPVQSDTEPIDRRTFTPAGQPGYRTYYENCLLELNHSRTHVNRWALNFFHYDQLTLVNRAALDDVGGWDTFIPYYPSDCDMHSRLEMAGWVVKERRVGAIYDISTHFRDLAALYRDTKVEPEFWDPSPLDPKAEWEIAHPDEPYKGDSRRVKRSSLRDRLDEKGEEEYVEEAEEDSSVSSSSRRDSSTSKSSSRRSANPTAGSNALSVEESLAYFTRLATVADRMQGHKHRKGSDLRNTWQKSQRGGAGEPYYYNQNGFVASFDAFVDAGWRVFREKWGHDNCALLSQTQLRITDQWRVEKDY